LRELYACKKFFLQWPCPETRAFLWLIHRKTWYDLFICLFQTQGPYQIG